MDEDLYRLIRSHEKGDTHTLQRILQVADRIHPEWKGILPISILKHLDLTLEEWESLPYASYSSTYQIGYTRWHAVYSTRNGMVYWREGKSRRIDNLLNLVKDFYRLRNRHYGIEVWDEYLTLLEGENLRYPDNAIEVIEQLDPEWFNIEIAYIVNTYGSFRRYLLEDDEAGYREYPDREGGSLRQVWERKFKELIDTHGPLAHAQQYLFDGISDNLSSKEVAEMILRAVRE